MNPIRYRMELRAQPVLIDHLKLWSHFRYYLDGGHYVFMSAKDGAEHAQKARDLFNDEGMRAETSPVYVNGPWDGKPLMTFKSRIPHKRIIPF